MDTFIHRFMLSTLLVTLLIITILLLKKGLSKHLSIKVHYKIWYFLFVPLMTPFFPWDFFKLGAIPTFFAKIFTQNAANSLKQKSMSGSTISHAENSDLLRDFAISVNRSTPEAVFTIGLIIWAIGIVVLAGWMIYSQGQIRQIKKSASLIKDQKIKNLLEECKEIVGVRREVALQETSMINSPITFGMIKPSILLPLKAQSDFSLDELKYVFLHELSHQKNKDVLVNNLMWALQIMYWFNPLVWYALKRIRIDRELACDASVLNLIDEDNYIDYGHTILHFARGKHDRVYEQFVPGIGGTKKQIKQRILSIAKHTEDSQLLRRKSIAICIALGMFVLCLTPLTYAAASSDAYELNGEKIVYEDLARYFQGFKGSFVLYDAFEDQYHIYNRKMSEQRVSPNSTYKIYSALFALEENVITPDSNRQTWDGEVHPYPEWNQNHNLDTAIGSSVNWYFQNLDRKMGKKQLQHYVDKIMYGNENLSGQLDRYWMESSLKISPIEQVELLVALQENRFGFKEENIQAVKKAISIEKKEHGQLLGKTGTGTVNGIDVNGWFIGYIEKDHHLYYFAINIQNDGANGSKAAEIANHILQDKSIYSY